MADSIYDVRIVKDYPKKGIDFLDITTLWKDPVAFKKHIDDLAAALEGIDYDCIVGLESRGFVIGSALAYLTGKSFIVIRKKGDLPTDKVTVEYKKEYGSDVFELDTATIGRGNKAVIVDDLLATGGTAVAAIQLIELAGAEVAATAFIFELSDLEVKPELKKYKVISLKKYP